MKNPSRKDVTKLLSYAALQTIVEDTLNKIPELRKRDDSKLKPFIFNNIVKRAKAIRK